MIKAALKTTSAIALCTALSTPPTFAQDSDTQEDLPVCSLTGPFPCVMDDGTVIENAAEFAAERAEEAIDSITGAEDEAPEGEAEDAPVVDLPPETEPETDVPPEDAPDVSVPPEDAPVMDDPPEDVPEVDAPPADAPEADVPPEDMPEVDLPPEDVPVVDEPAEDLPDEEQLPAESDDVMEATEPPLETPAEDETVIDQPAAEAVTDDAVEGEMNVEVEGETEGEMEADATEDETDSEVGGELEVETEGGATTDDTAVDDEMTDEQMTEDVAADTATDEMSDEAAEPITESAAAAEASDEDDLLLEENGEVTTEQVTEETARSSAEDFETTASGDVSAQVEQGGMSNFEKALLLGLGTIAVGAILANGAKIVNNSGDRIIIEQPDGTLRVLKNDDVTLRQPGSEVRTRTYEDGSTRTVVTRPNGVRIITIRAADGTALKRVRVMPNGDRYVLFDDTQEAEPVRNVPQRAPTADIEVTDNAALREALIASMNADVGRSYSLGQIRAFKPVRELAPKIEVRDITFATDSAAIRAEQAEHLADLGLAIADVIAEVPDAVFLVEGHTDAVGAASYNLALSDRRAESVALALTEYFDVPPENLVTQGYGESDLKVLTASSERANRRVAVRNITPLLR